MAYEEVEKETAVVNIKRMDQYEPDIRSEAADIYLEGFYSKFIALTKDRKQLSAMFRDRLRSDRFYVATMDGLTVGILGFGDNRTRAMPLDRTALRTNFGMVKGTIAYQYMKKEFNDPLPYDDDTGYIECAATSAEARGKGVSTALFRHAMDRLPYSKLVLEVLDVNENARRLYRKLDFEEFGRKPAKSAGERKMFNERILMRWQRS